jgi:CheY-like chemotaxis protein
MIGRPRSAPAVLIVEDDEDTREMFAELLRREGFSVRTSAGPDEALILAREVRPDVVVTDLFGPGPRALDVIARIRADEHLASTMVVVVTGWDVPAYRAQASDLNCAAFLLKPCPPSVLTSELRRIVANGPAVSSNPMDTGGVRPSR